MAWKVQQHFFKGAFYPMGLLAPLYPTVHLSHYLFIYIADKQNDAGTVHQLYSHPQNMSVCH